MNNPIYPMAHVDMLPEATTQPGIVPRMCILHTNAGSRSASPEQLRGYMGHDEVTVECHFDIGSGGDVWQYMPVNVRADCNAKANGFAVSIETQDHGSGQVGGVDAEPWTDAQVEAISGVLAWLNSEWGVPLRRVTMWNGEGVGGHRDYREWSGDAHSCPGNARAGQVDGIIQRAQMLRQVTVLDKADSVPVVVSPLVRLEEEMYYRDDRVDGWQIWYVGRDWTDALYAYPINDMPRKGDWGKLDALGVVPVKVSLGALVDIMNVQNRPTAARVVTPVVVADNVEVADVVTELVRRLNVV